MLWRGRGLDRVCLSAALGAGAGESVERGSLLEALELGGEACRARTVTAAAKLLRDDGRDAGGLGAGFRVSARGVCGGRSGSSALPRSVPWMPNFEW